MSPDLSESFESKTIRWVLPPCPQRAARVYTVRLFSSLLGLRAIVEEERPRERDGIRTVVYGPIDDDAESKLFVIEPDLYFWSRVEAGSDITPSGVSEWRGVPFPRWAESGVSRKSHAASTFVCPVDPIAAAFFLVSRIEEWRSEKVDRHGRYPADEAWMTRMGLLERPLVHEFAATFAAWIGIEDPFAAARALWPGGHPFAIAFTHDVDRLRMHGNLWYDARSTIGALRLRGGLSIALRRVTNGIAVHLGGRKDPYDTFDELTEGHSSSGNRATYFWICAQHSVKNADYDGDSPRAVAVMEKLRDAGHEIALHGTFDSFEHGELLREEKAALERVSAMAVTSTRQHFLRFRVSATWQAQERAGLVADSTLGFSGRLGFRAGLAVPFRPWDFTRSQPYDLWEVPMVMMDVTARDYMGLHPGEAIARSRRILAQVERVGGAVAVLWHNSSLNDLDWCGWKPVYDSWLEYARMQNAWGATVSQIVDAYSRQLIPSPNCIPEP